MRFGFSMRNSDSGFTLFEVLGAVAILAIVYTTLSTVAIRGLRLEGESRRMLEASLLADWELSAFELELEAGAAPEIGITTTEMEDGFTVTWEVTPLQTAIFENSSKQDRDARASIPAGQSLQVPAGQSGTTKDGEVPFLQVALKISWFEAGNERSVTRVIFAVDEDAAANFAAERAKDEAAIEGEPR
jgi:prepilin-type N-terminal cleavage/methylation domain-containing protein